MLHHPVTASAPPDDDLPDPAGSLGRHLRLAWMMLGAMLLCLLAAATIVRVTSAVVAIGEVAVASHVQRVSHPTGGVIAAILVQNGSRVRKGQPLLRFDSRVAAVGAAMTGRSLDQLLARRARLAAERDGLDSIPFPSELATRSDAPARQAMAGESRLFALRRAALNAQRAQLAQRVGEAGQQIEGYRAQIDANQRQQALIAPELEGVRGLWRRKLVTINRLNELERTAVSLDGNSAALRASIAQARAQIAEVRQQSIQLLQQYRSDAAADLAATEQALSDQRQRRASAADSYDRTVLRAPTSGIVDQLAFTTVGGVIPAGARIMDIVPQDGAMTVEARIAPADVDRVHAGQRARIAFPAFNRQTTPQIRGMVALLSAGRADDQRTGQGYYDVRIDLPASEVARLGGLELRQGMPAQAFIRTGRRSLLSYLTKPLRDQIAHAFRGE